MAKRKRSKRLKHPRAVETQKPPHCCERYARCNCGHCIECQAEKMITTIMGRALLNSWSMAPPRALALAVRPVPSRQRIVSYAECA